MKNVNHEVLMLTNHKNFSRFILTIKFSFRQIRWIQKLFRYHFIIDYQSDNKNSTDELFKWLNYITITQEKVNANRQILHKLQMSLRKRKFNKKVHNAHVTMLIVLKNVNSFNFKKKNEILLKSSATSTKMKKNEILMTLKFSTLNSVVCFKKKRLMKFNTKLILIVCFDERRLIIIAENMIIHVLKRAAAKAIEDALLLK